MTQGQPSFISALLPGAAPAPALVTPRGSSTTATQGSRYKGLTGASNALQISTRVLYGVNIFRLIWEDT